MFSQPAVLYKYLILSTSCSVRISYTLNQLFYKNILYSQPLVLGEYLVLTTSCSKRLSYTLNQLFYKNILFSQPDVLVDYLVLLTSCSSRISYPSQPADPLTFLVKNRGYVVLNCKVYHVLLRFTVESHGGFSTCSNSWLYIKCMVLFHPCLWLTVEGKSDFHCMMTFQPQPLMRFKAHWLGTWHLLYRPRKCLSFRLLKSHCTKQFLYRQCKS